MLMERERLDQNPDLQAWASDTPDNDIELRHFVMLTEPNREVRARDFLKDVLKLNPWLPLETIRSYRSVNTTFGVQRRPYDSCRPIFRGYIFVPLNLAWSFGPLYDAPYLRQNGHPFLRLNGSVAVLDESDVRLVRTIEAICNTVTPIPGVSYDLGEQVRVVDGPFADRIAQISRLDAEGRIELLMDILGRKTKFHASAAQIAKL